MADRPDPSIDVLCAGETMALVAPRRAEPLRDADEFVVDAAGAESNVAMHLALDGARAAWASRLGTDPLGDRVLGAVAAAGVDIRHVERIPVRTGVYFKDPSPAGTRVHYYRDGSAAATMDPAFADTLPIADARVLHLSGITPALSPACAGFVRRAVDRARRADVLVSVDVNYRPGLWPVADAAPALRDLARSADLVFVGADEATTLWGPLALDELAALLAPRDRLVVKDGAVRASDVSVSGAVHAPAPVVDVVEAVGAGDAFAAGYLAALLGGAAPLERLENGHRFAARALSSTSDVAPPILDGAAP